MKIDVIKRRLAVVEDTINKSNDTINKLIQD